MLHALGRHLAAGEPEIFALLSTLLGSTSATDEHYGALLLHCIAQPLPPPVLASVSSAGRLFLTMVCSRLALVLYPHAARFLAVAARRAVELDAAACTHALAAVVALLASGRH